MDRQSVARTTALLIASALAGSILASCHTIRSAPTTEWAGSLVSLHMISETTGWAEAIVPPPTPGPVSGRLILRTTNGGRHWSNVTPPQLTPQVQGGVPTQYMDENRAWVMALAGPGQVRVMRTMDGGTQWQETVIRDSKVVYQLSNTGSAQFSFVDANHGWLFVSYGHDGDEAGALYKTVDGGSQWSFASTTDPNVGSGTGIPLEGFKTGITFLDQKNGWLTGVTYRSKPLLYATHDAGTTWSRVTYPDAPGIVFSGGHSVTKPRFFSPTSGVFEVLAGRSIVYTTTNGGSSWQPTVSPGCCEIFFLDVNNGWALAFTSENPASEDLVATSDAGRHWRPVHARLDAQTRNEVSQHFVTELRSLDFVTPEIGYVIRASGPVVLAGSGTTPIPKGTESLLRTTDGGATWAEVWSMSS